MADEADLGARNMILHRCDLMRIEDHRMFDTKIIRAAWPPTGDKDDAPGLAGLTRGEFADLALAYGENKPDPGLTSIEGIRAALGSKFEVYERPAENAVEVHRVR